MTTIAKRVYHEKRVWFGFDLDLHFLNEKIFNCYRKISLGDYEDKKKYFKDLHYIKIQKDLINLNMCHYRIKRFLLMRD